MNLRLLRGKRVMGERSWRNQKPMGFQPSVWCGLGWENRVTSFEMAGKSVLLEKRDPCGWFLVGGDISGEEGMKSWRRGEVRGSSLSECTGRWLKTAEKDLRSI